ncbi:hypothetical protein B0H14DRAFT_2582862 [Mycena olivaceomarginata]|nr:hypothetical protein B0H14DRAFT_2582862 [Mycena olivaceomarginata]
MDAERSNLESNGVSCLLRSHDSTPVCKVGVVSLQFWYNCSLGMSVWKPASVVLLTQFSTSTRTQLLKNRDLSSGKEEGKRQAAKWSNPESNEGGILLDTTITSEQKAQCCRDSKSRVTTHKVDFKPGLTRLDSTCPIRATRSRLKSTRVNGVGIFWIIVFEAPGNTEKTPDDQLWKVESQRNINGLAQHWEHLLKRLEFIFPDSGNWTWAGYQGRSAPKCLQPNSISTDLNDCAEDLAVNYFDLEVAGEIPKWGVIAEPTIQAVTLVLWRGSWLLFVLQIHCYQCCWAMNTFCVAKGG